MPISEYPRSPLPKIGGNLWYADATDRFWVTGYNITSQAPVVSGGIRTTTHILHRMERLPAVNSTTRVEITSALPATAYFGPNTEEFEVIGADGIFYKWFQRQSVSGQPFTGSNGAFVRVDPSNNEATYYNVVSAANLKPGTAKFSATDSPQIFALMHLGTPAEGYLFCAGGNLNRVDELGDNTEAEGLNQIGLYRTNPAGMFFLTTVSLPVELMPRGEALFGATPRPPMVNVQGRFTPMPDGPGGTKRALYYCNVGGDFESITPAGDFAVFLLTYTPTTNTLTATPIVVERRANGDDFFGFSTRAFSVHVAYDPGNDRILVMGNAVNQPDRQAVIVSLGGAGYATRVWERAFSIFHVNGGFLKTRILPGAENIALPVGDYASSVRPYTWLRLSDGSISAFTTIYGSVPVDRAAQFIQYDSDTVYLSDSVGSFNNNTGSFFSMRVATPDLLVPPIQLPPGASNLNLLAWDSAADRRVYRWRSKLFLNPIPSSYQAAHVRALDYADITLRIIADGVVIFERVVTSDAPFTLPPLPQRETLIEIEGTSTVRVVEIANDMEELT